MGIVVNSRIDVYPSHKHKHQVQDDDEPVDVSESEFFKLGILGKSGIWIDYSAKTYGEARINVYTPLFYGDSVIGVITGILGGKKDISPKLSYMVNGEQTIGLLCDRELNIVSSSFPPTANSLCVSATNHPSVFQLLQ